MKLIQIATIDNSALYALDSEGNVWLITDTRPGGGWEIEEVVRAKTIHSGS